MSKGGRERMSEVDREERINGRMRKERKEGGKERAESESGQTGGRL